MATGKQVQAARRNVKKAQAAARSKKTLSKLPRAVRQDMGRQGAKARQRGGRPGHRLEDRTRPELYELAKRRNVPGRSRMGKWELIEALRKAG
jgi:Rho termination factor, N-terminal domain